MIAMEPEFTSPIPALDFLLPVATAGSASVSIHGWPTHLSPYKLNTHPTGRGAGVLDGTGARVRMKKMASGPRPRVGARSRLSVKKNTTGGETAVVGECGYGSKGCDVRPPLADGSVVPDR